MEVIAPWVEVEEYDGIAIMQKIERACRTCYRSEGIITDTSYQNLLKNCISRGHESILEHEKITIRMCCDVGVYKDLTRHRTGTAFSIESTRYCNYSKDKFTNNIKFIHPIFIQDEENYSFMRLRASLVPIVNLSSYAGYIAIVLGIIMGALNFIWIGIALEVVILLFQLITLPVEFDASKKALREVEKYNILNNQEIKAGKTVLTSAALT